MMEQIRQFIESQRAARIVRSVWFEDDNIKVYLRAGEYHVDPETREWKYAVGVSNVYVIRQADQGKGYFKELMVNIERWAKEYGYDVMRVEEVRNVKLQNWLSKHGYTFDPEREDPQASKKL